MLQNQQECPCNQCSTDPYFKIENCFNELVTEVQKANARYNLGIADEWNLKWGNITGFVENQKDLAQYLDSFIIVYKEEITQAINDLQDKLESKIQEQVDLLEEDRRKIEDLIKEEWRKNDGDEKNKVITFMCTEQPDSYTKIIFLFQFINCSFENHIPLGEWRRNLFLFTYFQKGVRIILHTSS